MNNRTKHLHSLARLMDSQFRLGGFRFGLDGLLGLIPGVGDIVTTGVSIYIIAEAARLGCSNSTLVRMALNVAFENLAGIVPVIGNVFDFLWKANNKNILLLDKYQRNPVAVTKRSRLVLVGLAALMLAGLVLTLLVTFLLIKTFFVAIRESQIDI